MRCPWPKISVVTPSFNQGQFLEEAIRSVLLQDYPNLEFIIIDGGSNDESLDIIRKYENHLSFWVSEKDYGHADALNKGFARTSGEIMFWINSDDLLMPGALRTVGELFGSFPEIEWLTTTKPVVCDTNTNMKVIECSGYSRRFLRRGGYLGESYSNPAWIQQESTFWRRSLWLKAARRLGEQTRLAVDFELWNRFAEHASLNLVNHELGCWRYHDTQRSKALETYRAESWACLQSRPSLMLKGLASLWRRARFGSLVPWMKLMAALYGESVSVFQRDAHSREWIKVSKRVA